MESYLIGYDLEKRGGNYPELIVSIEKLSDVRRRCLHSTWIVKSDSEEADIRDALASYIDADESLLIVRLAGQGAWAGLNQECSAWLVDNL
jgi:hypothetical protein